MSADNPPAFPRTGEGFGNENYDTPGMTLRDWFAGQALAGLTGDTRTINEANEAEDPAQQMADWAYIYADAMLAARVTPARNEEGR